MMTRMLLTLLLLVVLSGCGRTFQVEGVGHLVAADDGTQLATYELYKKSHPDAPPRALLFYIQGSGEFTSFADTGSITVLNVMPKLASGVIAGFRPVLMERRGVGFKGVVEDEAAVLVGLTMETRIADHLAVIQSYLDRFDSDLPVLLVGGSEGGLVAGAIAAREPRITHLMLLGSGGWPQAREFEYLLQREGDVLGMTSQSELQAKLDDIARHPDAVTMWAGHPYRRWSSFLWYDPRPDIASLQIPVFIAHGTADQSVPIASARALRDALANDSDAQFTYVELEGLDHQWMDIATGQSGYPKLEIEMLSFLRDHDLLSAAEHAQFVNHVHGAHPELFKQ